MKLRRLFLGRKVMTNLDSVLKSRDIILPIKVHRVKAMVFPVVMYGCERPWRKLSTEELMLLNCGVGEDSWESLGLQDQSILKEINPGYSLEGLMLKLQYFGLLMWRADSLEKTLMLGKTEGRRRGWVREDEMVGWHHRLNGHEFEQTPGGSEGQGSLACCSPWSCKESGKTELLNSDDSTTWSEAGWITDAGPQIWRAEYKVRANFQLLGGLVPLTSALFEGQLDIIIIIIPNVIITIINETGMTWRVLRRWCWTPQGAHCGLLPQRLSVARIVPTKSPTEKWDTFLLLHRASFSFFVF